MHHESGPHCQTHRQPRHTTNDHNVCETSVSNTNNSGNPACADSALGENCPWRHVAAAQSAGATWPQHAGISTTGAWVRGRLSPLWDQPCPVRYTIAPLREAQPNARTAPSHANTSATTSQGSTILESGTPPADLEHELQQLPGPNPLPWAVMWAWRDATASHHGMAHEGENMIRQIPGYVRRSGK